MKNIFVPIFLEKYYKISLKGNKIQFLGVQFILFNTDFLGNPNWFCQTTRQITTENSSPSASKNNSQRRKKKTGGGV